MKLKKGMYFYRTGTQIDKDFFFEAFIIIKVNKKEKEFKFKSYIDGKVAIEESDWYPFHILEDEIKSGRLYEVDYDPLNNYEPVNPAEELLRCQKYYEELYCRDNVIINDGMTLNLKGWDNKYVADRWNVNKDEPVDMKDYLVPLLTGKSLERWNNRNKIEKNEKETVDEWKEYKMQQDFTLPFWKRFKFLFKNKLFFEISFNAKTGDNKIIKAQVTTV